MMRHDFDLGVEDRMINKMRNVYFFSQADEVPADFQFIGRHIRTNIIENIHRFEAGSNDIKIVQISEEAVEYSERLQFGGLFSLRTSGNTCLLFFFNDFKIALPVFPAAPVRKIMLPLSKKAPHYPTR